MRNILLISLAVFTLLACGSPDSDPSSPAPANSSREPDSGASEVATGLPSQAYFGDLHVHTSWSTDAYAGGNRVGPADAYRFAQGEAVELPNGMVTQLHAPLDFVALTDHAEGFDSMGACMVEEHPLYDSEACRNMRSPGGNRQEDYLRLVFARSTSRPAQRDPELCADNDVCLAAARDTWQRVQAVANEFDQPGEFTALIGYEFSSLLPHFGMLHRNVIFRGAEVIPHAFSSLDVAGQADFFKLLDQACQAPCEVLTIPHNTNYSWGLTFSRTDEDGTEYTQEDRQRRVRLDRLVEVTQQKGNSECQVGVGFADEDCDFGNIFPLCTEGETGRCATESSFVRNALLDGIQMRSEGSENIFKLGMIGSTDTHNSDPGNTNPKQPTRSAAIMGDAEAIRQSFVAEHVVVGPLRKTSPGGLAGVWAAENTRTAIFDALQRREAFATSGSRLRIRFFAGDLPDDIESRPDQIEVAYRDGVPMGGDLDAARPTFWAWVMQDPNSASLDRIQIIKGWIDETGAERQKVWDVACADGREPNSEGQCPPTSATVDTSDCSRSDGLGAQELQATFTDPDYSTVQHAFYYVRALENPTCRWSTWVANSAGLEPPSDVPTTEQQRGWSSPIWVSPN